MLAQRRNASWVVTVRQRIPINWSRLNKIYWTPVQRCTDLGYLVILLFLNAPPPPDGIRFISARNGPIATKQKANISIKLYASNVTIKFDLCHDLDYEFKGQIWNLPYLTQRWFDCNKMKSTHVEWTKGRNDHQVWPWPWPWKVRYKDLPDSDRGDFRCRCAVDSSSYYQLDP